MSTNKKLRIAIVGAGIAGLSLFQALRSMDREDKFDIKIYDSAKMISEIGVGITLSPRAVQILREIGLEDLIARILPDRDTNTNPDVLLTHFVIRKGDLAEGFQAHETKRKGERAGKFLRRELIDVLRHNLTNELHLAHQLLSYEEHDDEIVLHFDKGLTGHCDFLVGADGIRSTVRKCFLAKHGLSHSASMDPVWSGTYIYRGLVAFEQLEAGFPGHRICEAPVMYIGKNKNLIAYRVSRAGPVNVVGITSDPSKEGTMLEGPSVVPCSQDELLSVFQGWEPEALALVKCPRVDQPLKWALKTLPPLASFAEGRVALVGDSAHAMAPYQAAGGGTAIEDSYILASLLSSPNCTKASIPRVSEVYDTMRVGPANQIAELSRVAGVLYQFRGPGFENVVEGDASVTADQMQGIFQTIVKMWEPLMVESLEESRERALKMLQEQIPTD